MLGTPRLVLLLTAALLAPYSYTLSTQALAQGSDNDTKLRSIKGRVLADGQAVTDATVTVASVNSSRQSRTVPTNDNGDFDFKGLEPGMYRVEVSAPAYVSVPADRDESIYRAGDSITLNMIKAGVITGKVVTAGNDPVVAVRVRALMIRDANGRPTRTEPSRDRLTDDRGVYRMFGLVPGTYVISAGGRGFSGTGANAYDNDAPTFAPSSTRDTADEITLGSGEERTVDIRYRGTGGHAVSGNVNALSTPENPWMRVNLARVVNSALDVSVFTYQNARVKGFEFQGVADGDYFIWTSFAARGGELLVSEPKRIAVKGADVTGIELIARPLASVAGAVVLEPSTVAECKDKRRPLFEETLVSLQRNQKNLPKQETATQTVDVPLYGSSQATPDSAGSFQLRNLAAGQYNFNLRMFAKYWYLRSVTLPAGKDPTTNDIARSLLTLKSGDRVTGVKATLAEGAASVTGQVELPEDRRAGTIVVYVVPAEKDKADEVLRYFAAPVDADGSFTQDHVPPGRYWALAKFVTVENEANSTALRLPSQAAARVRLRREAEAAKVELELKPCQIVRDQKLPLASN